MELCELIQTINIGRLAEEHKEAMFRSTMEENAELKRRFKALDDERKRPEGKQKHDALDGMLRNAFRSRPLRIMAYLSAITPWLFCAAYYLNNTHAFSSAYRAIRPGIVHESYTAADDRRPGNDHLIPADTHPYAPHAPLLPYAAEPHADSISPADVKHQAAGQDSMDERTGRKNRKKSSTHGQSRQPYRPAGRDYRNENHNNDAQSPSRVSVSGQDARLYDGIPLRPAIYGSRVKEE